MQTRSLFLLSFTILLFMITGCLNKKDIEVNEEDLSNQDRMKLLQIDDPAIWNTLATQVIDTTEIEPVNELKSAQAMQEYPKGGNYYFALFEDLYPSEGDYDFNDVIIRTKLGLAKKGKTITGYVDSDLYNKGGSLPVRIGLMFYEVSGEKYSRIPNKDITVNGERLTADGDPWSVPLSEIGDSWKIDFSFENKSDNIWVSYFIYTDVEIFTGGFAPSSVTSFEVPQPHFLSSRNLPWGLEIEAESFAIPNEKELFLNAFPEFQEWAESGGVKNKKWFESPDDKYTHY